MSRLIGKAVDIIGQSDIIGVAMSNPVETLIKKFGTQERLGKAAGVGQSSVADWKTRGWIPAQRQRAILRNAADYGVAVTPDDFFDLADNGKGEAAA